MDIEIGLFKNTYFVFFNELSTNCHYVDFVSLARLLKQIFRWSLDVNNYFAS